jgi:glycosyltransferase involved in cell wall biosynthesis
MPVIKARFKKLYSCSAQRAHETGERWKLSIVVILCEISLRSRIGYAAGILAETMAAHEPQPVPPKRLLHVVASFSPAAEGTTEGIRRLAESCAGLCAVEVVCLDDPSEPYVHGQSFPVHALGPTRGHYGYTPRLSEWLGENLARFDGLVIHGLWQYHSYGSYRLARGRIPYVVFPHGMLDPYFKRAFPLKHVKKQMYWLGREYRVLRDAKAVCFTTPIERDAAGKTFWPRRWNPVVVSFGSAQPEGDPATQRGAFLDRYPALRQRRFFLFLSRIHSKKGCDLLLEAFGRLAAAQPDLDLVMAGPDEGGLRPQLEAQAKRLGIEHRVHWTGMVEGDVKWGALHSAYAFVLPSHQENFGVAVVESLACGVPVLISDKVNIWPEIAQDEAGIVNPDTAEGTFRSMATLLKMNAEERRRMVSNGLSCFHARYEMKRTAQVLNDLF